MSYYVYILASGRNGTLYIGVTNDIRRRMEQHLSGEVEGFTRRYSIKILVYVERAEDARVAIQREKQIKTWNRSWKIRLIEEMNPEWRNLVEEL